MDSSMGENTKFPELNIEILMILQQLRPFNTGVVTINSRIVGIITDIVNLVRTLVSHTNPTNCAFTYLGPKILKEYTLRRQYFCKIDNAAIVCNISLLAQHLVRQEVDSNENGFSEFLLIISSIINPENMKQSNLIEFYFDLMYFHHKLSKLAKIIDQQINKEVPLLTTYFFHLLIEELKMYLDRPKSVQKYSVANGIETYNVFEYFTCNYGVENSNELLTAAEMWSNRMNEYYINRINELEHVSNRYAAIRNRCFRPGVIYSPPTMGAVPFVQNPIPIPNIIPNTMQLPRYVTLYTTNIPYMQPYPINMIPTIPAIPPRKDITMFLHKLNDEQYFTKRLDVTMEKNKHMFVAIESSIVAALEPKFPKIKVIPCGPRYLGINNSQYFNMHINLEGDLFKPMLLADTFKDTIMDLLKKDQHWSCIKICQNNEIFLSAKYSLHKQIYPVILTFMNGIDACLSNLIEYFFNLQPMCRKFSNIFNKWMDVLNLSDTFNSCVATLLVIYYFQHIKLLPSVEVLQLGMDDIERIKNWPCNFQRKSLMELGMHKVIHSPERLLCDLFNFYGTIFSFNLHVVSPFVGYPLARDLFNPGQEAQLPYSFRVYKENMHNCAPDNVIHFNNTTPACVQDPFCLINNVAFGIDLNSLKKFQYFCNLSANEFSKCVPK